MHPSIGVAMASRQPSTPVQLRLPAWAAEFIDTQAKEGGTTRSGVMIQALECLRQRELERLMEQGYREMAESNQALAEDGLTAGGEAWPSQ
jgi:hypothetical protein